ncbi:MAG: hypothetical protein FVQ79_08525 [Planctomycetes bacterium]|nr:hypothetical protein [Planctomycetota bacterium]
MAGMFYTLDEVVEKLGKSKEQVQSLVDTGKLREFWDGNKQLFKVSDVDSLLEELPTESEMVDIETAADEPVIDPDDDAASLEETAGSDTLGILIGDDTGGDEGEGLLESSELGEALDADGNLEALTDSIGEISIPVEGEESGEAVIEKETAVSIDENDESLKLQGTSISDESLKLQGTSIADESLGILAGNESESGLLGNTGEELASAILPDDSMDFLLSDATGVESPLEEDGNLLSDETLSGLLGDSGKGKEEGSGELNMIGEDEVSLGELTNADTSMGTAGVNVLAESEGDFDLISDSKSETLPPESESDLDFDLEDGGDSAGLGDLDADINLDSIGSGSGLLDLSLQADDTSLGAVLDDILPSVDDIGDMPEADSIGEESVAEEADKIFEDEEPQPIMAPAGGTLAARYIEPEPTGSDNLFGGLLLVPFAILIYATLILLLSFANVKPTILTAVSKDISSLAMLWWVFFGLIVVLGVVFAAAAMMGSDTGEKKVKAKKAKKAKKPKKKKGKK